MASVAEAELTKLIENTFRHVNVALVNDLAMFAADLGIDVWEALRAAPTKPFGYMPFTSGPGVGGPAFRWTRPSCPGGSASVSGAASAFIDLAYDINDHMPAYVISRLTAALVGTT